jgi:1-deoxy-D-xylulose-5-phosphate reductoisomerase
VNLARLNSLTFETINYAMFPCLQLALDAGKKGGTYPAVLCAADEIAVQLFLEQRIAFPQIAEIIDKSISLHQNVDNPTLEEILSADEWARDTALKSAAR